MRKEKKLACERESLRQAATDAYVVFHRLEGAHHNIVDADSNNRALLRESKLKIKTEKTKE